MTLRATTIAGGQLQAEMLVDPKVCDCCQTSAARIDGGVIIAYRDRSDREVRDIAVSRFINGAWSPPALVHADNWEINACPVNGPAVAAIGRSVAVAWYTMAGGPSTGLGAGPSTGLGAGGPRAKLAFSSDGGATFGAPIVLNQEPTYGRLALTMLDADRVLVSSIERGSAGAQLVVREVRRDGRSSEPTVVAPTSSDRSSGFPRMAISGRRVLFAWTAMQPDKSTQVTIASARLK
jgi:hypothetical protein